MSIRIAVILVVLALTGCPGGGEPPPDAPPDAGTGTPDSGTPDSGTDAPDSGTDTPDSGTDTPDSGTGTPDSGTDTPDSGTGTPTGCFQVPEKSPEWSGEGFMFGTDKSEELLDVAVNSQGMLYLAGYENGSIGTARIDPSGDARGVLLRVGKAPEEEGGLTTVWQRTIDIEGSAETIEALAFHPVTGALYFTGRTTGSFPGYTNQGQQDLFVAGPRGTERDVILYQGGTVRPQRPNRLAFDAQGDLIVSGYDDVYVPSNYVERWEDPFVTKLRRSEDGLSMNQLWWRQFDTTYTDMLGGLAVDPTDSTIYVTGGNSGGTQRGAFVQKIDNATGQQLVSWRQTAVGLDMMQAAHIRSDGNVLVAGSTFALLGKQSYGDQDVVVRLLDKTTGQPLWTTQFGSAESDWMTDMAVDAQGNIIVVGETLGAVDPNSINQGVYDVFMMKFDPDGNLLFAKQWGSEGDDHPSAVAVDACGEAFIVGYTTGDLLGPDFPVQGSRDAFVITTARAREPDVSTGVDVTP